MMKCYLGTLKVQNGEYEHYSTIKFKTDKNPEKVLNDAARDWYDGAKEEDGKGSGVWYANGSEVAVNAEEFQEIDEDTFAKITLITEY